MKVYIAGPMSHVPQMNFPAFDKAAQTLRARGHEVVSPAELDSPESRAAALASVDGDPSGYAEGETWGNFLARDVKLIADEGIEAIVVLPRWEKSRGARLETFVGRLCGLPILTYWSLEHVDDASIDIAHASDQVRTEVEGEGYPKAREHNHMIASAERRGILAGVEPNGETRITNSETGGQKGQKAQQFNLIPWEQLASVAELYAKGAEKYAAHNWRKGFAWSLSFDSLIRHAMAFWGGEELDPETRCKHLASVVFHCFALMYFTEHFPALDDRPPCPT